MTQTLQILGIFALLLYITDKGTEVALGLRSIYKALKSRREYRAWKKSR